MELTTLLNRCYRFKGFVYKEARFAPGKPDTIEVEVIPRQGSKPYCSGCGKRRAGYDKLPERTFQFIPFGALRSSSGTQDGELGYWQRAKRPWQKWKRKHQIPPRPMG